MCLSKSTITNILGGGWCKPSTHREKIHSQNPRDLKSSDLSSTLSAGRRSETSAADVLEQQFDLVQTSCLLRSWRLCNGSAQNKASLPRRLIEHVIDSKQAGTTQQGWEAKMSAKHKASKKYEQGEKRRAWECHSHPIAPPVCRHD
jgi:hypothetical protein